MLRSTGMKNQFQIRQKVELRNWEFTLAAIVASSTLLQAIAAMFPFGGDAETN